MDRRSLLLGFLAGGWLVTLLAVTSLSPFRSAGAADAPGGPPAGRPADPVTPTTPGRTINPSEGARERGIPSPGSNTAAFNNRAIALAGSVGSGESVVYYFDTEAQRLLVYQFKTGDRGGIRLMAARHFDYDLRLEDYRDLSDRTRDGLKADYDRLMKGAGAPGVPPGGVVGPELPPKKVELPTGK
jgi:hypothetical protein